MPKAPLNARTEPALANTIGRGPPKATYPQFHTKTSQNVDNYVEMLITFVEKWINLVEISSGEIIFKLSF